MTTNTIVTPETVEEAIIAAEILAAESTEMDVADPAQALAEANGIQAAIEAEEANADEASDEAPAQDQAAAYEDLVAAISDADAEGMKSSLLAALQVRAQYEAEQNPNNMNIQKTLSKLVRTMPGPNMVRGLIVTGTGAGVVNKSEMGSKRRNVYALDKLQDLLYGATTGHVKNAINRAILATMVLLKDQKLPVTGDVAKGAASDKWPVPPAYKPFMRSHTVAASTASTQMSSTMTALEDLGAVKNTGTMHKPVFEFTDTPIARRLEEVVRTKILVPVI